MKPFTIGWSRVVVMVVGCFLLGSGCIKIDATVTLAPDGSGTMKAMYGMPTFLIKQAETVRQTTRSLLQAEGRGTNVVLPRVDIPMVFDEDALKARFSRMKSDGLQVTEYRTKEMGGWRYVDFTVKFSSLESLARQSFFKDCGFKLGRVEGGAYRVDITLPKIGGEGGTPDFADPDRMALLTPFLNGMRVVVRLDVPGLIRQSSSSRSDSRRATWEWDFDKDGRVLERLVRDTISVEFDGDAARLREFDKRPGVTTGRPVVTTK